VSDATAGYWNPAALANIRDNPQLSLMHAEYYAVSVNTILRVLRCR